VKNQNAALGNFDGPPLYQAIIFNSKYTVMSEVIKIIYNKCYQRNDASQAERFLGVFVLCVLMTVPLVILAVLS